MESHTNEKIRLLYSLQMINNYAQVSLEKGRGRKNKEKKSEIEKEKKEINFLL